MDFQESAWPNHWITPALGMTRNGGRARSVIGALPDTLADRSITMQMSQRELP
jgi:hypothetical protein